MLQKTIEYQLATGNKECKDVRKNQGKDKCHANADKKKNECVGRYCICFT